MTCAFAACAFGQSDPVARQTTGIVSLATGLRIDWTNRHVELDGKVVLREGILELFACSPNTREHESILVVPVAPQKIYDALGLIGLDPGDPVRYDEHEKRWLPPKGGRLDIKLRWKVDQREYTAHPRDWLKSTHSNAPVPRLEWVFAGSARGDNGSLYAVEEGTIICLVDFASALIALPQLYSADNELVWVQAATDAIPPIGTNVTMILSPSTPPTLVLTLTAHGRYLFNDKPVDFKWLVERIRRFESDHRPCAVTVRVEVGVPTSDIDALTKNLHQVIDPETALTVEKQKIKSKVDPPSGSSHSDRP